MGLVWRVATSETGCADADESVAAADAGVGRLRAMTAAWHRGC